MLVEVARDVPVDIDVDVARVVGALVDVDDVPEPEVTVTLHPSPQPARPKRSAPIAMDRVVFMTAQDTRRPPRSSALSSQARRLGPPQAWGRAARGPGAAQT